MSSDDHADANDYDENGDRVADGCLRVWKATDLAPPKKPEWIAQGRLPRAAISVLVGEEGIGKSMLHVWLTAHITTGMPHAGFGIPAREPGNVLLVLTEDDWSSTVRPRLEVAGADLDRVQVICAEADGSGTPYFPTHTHLITEAEPKPDLVVVDAFLDTVAPGLSLRDPQGARQALHPFKEVATRTGAAVLLITHTNRLDARNARDKYGATSELRKKARMTLYAQQDNEGALVIGPEKTNLAKLANASRFVIESRQYFVADDDGDGTVPRLKYVGEASKTARDYVADKYDDDHAPTAGPAQTKAAEWLTEHIAANGGAVDSREAKDAALAAGISERTLKRAASEIGVHTEDHGFPRRTKWSLSVGPPSDVLLELGPTGPTGADQQKRIGPTVQSRQSGQQHTDSPAVGPTEGEDKGRPCEHCSGLISENRVAAGFRSCVDCRNLDSRSA